MFPLYALSLALLVPANPDQRLPSISLEDLPHQPFVELLERDRSEEYSPDELRALRSKIEQERDERIEALRKTEETWKKQLASDRHDLETLNKASSTDSEDGERRRAALHIEIAALERGIRDKALERERTLPAQYELQLTKLWLVERWPERRTEILQRIGEGQARNRRHGDAVDIGYRKLVNDPEKDIETGEQAARQMVAGGWLPFELQDNEVQVYVRRIAAKIAANSDLKVPLHVTVLDSRRTQGYRSAGRFSLRDVGRDSRSTERIRTCRSSFTRDRPDRGSPRDASVESVLDFQIVRAGNAGCDGHLCWRTGQSRRVLTESIMVWKELEVCLDAH